MEKAAGLLSAADGFDYGEARPLVERRVGPGSLRHEFAVDSQCHSHRRKGELLGKFGNGGGFGLQRLVVQKYLHGRMMGKMRLVKVVILRSGEGLLLRTAKRRKGRKAVGREKQCLRQYELHQVVRV